MNDNLQIPYCPTPQNLYFYNPVQPGNELYYGFNPNYNLVGYHYDKEMFYIIDFFNIVKNTYVISSYGRVFTFNTGKERILPISKQYKRVSLSIEENGELKKGYFSVHRLVAMAFIPKTLEDLELGRDVVNHKDTIKSNNYYKNLEWCTTKENNIHAIEMDVRNRIKIITQPEIQKETKPISGDRIGLSRITEEQVHIICQNLIQGKSYDECCIAAGLEPIPKNKTAVSNIAGGHRRIEIGKQYGITKENKLTRDIRYKSDFIEATETLLRQGFKIKKITEMLNIDEDYNRARQFVGRVKKNMIERGEL